ncbi:hypothetical protein H0H93_007986 [Arthromyces matolae]|nr:hypothetical protein H0H93_007986 [Arthromyces matolae]
MLCWTSDIYYECFPGDRIKMKALVYGIFSLEAIQFVLVTADAFHWFGKGYGNMLMLSDPFISPFDAPIMGGIVAFIVQIFFCWRIWELQKSWWLPLVVFVAAATCFAGAIATGVGLFQMNDLMLIDTLKWQPSVRGLDIGVRL